jgi:prepilin-type N-terminal cleavage/methylation domain-containing protein
MRLKRGAEGFTLVELLIAIVILGVITVPLGNVVFGYFRNTDATTARLIESHDAQISSAYWAQDVASIGTRSTTAPYPLNQSVWTGASSLYACPAAGTPLVTLVRDELTPAGATTLVQVVYATQTVSGHTELHRVRCEGSAANLSDTTLAHDLDPLTPPTVTCSGTSGANCAAAGSGVPQFVTLGLTIKDSKNLGAAYVITLTGQRRQS